MTRFRENAKAITHMREIVKCCNEDGGGYVITQPQGDLFVVWQWEVGDDDWSRVWWAEGVRNAGWSYVDYARRDGVAVIPSDNEHIPEYLVGMESPVFPARREVLA